MDAGPGELVAALGELGAHLVDDIGLAGTNAYAGDMRAWLPYAGMRGGVSVRPRLAGPVRLVVGVWAFARVDLAHKDATVALTHPTGSALYDVGGWNLGWAARFGFELYSKLS